jgi:hypothetical protein
MIYIHIVDFTAAIRFGWFHNDLYQFLFNLDNMMQLRWCLFLQTTRAPGLYQWVLIFSHEFFAQGLGPENVVSLWLLFASLNFEVFQPNRFLRMELNIDHAKTRSACTHVYQSAWWRAADYGWNVKHRSVQIGSVTCRSVQIEKVANCCVCVHLSNFFVLSGPSVFPQDDNMKHWNR